MTRRDEPTQGPNATGLGVKRVPLQGARNLEAMLEPGSVLAGRYEIQQMLGLGGMGAVYKAWDRLLERIVAIKIIRPDLADDPELLQRFKQEVILARDVTHKNVVRLFDITETEELKFITMEYIDGKDLRTVATERGPMPARDAAELMGQVVSALEAAHAEGVVHRDLKPGNIMVQPNGRVVVMDFGLARSLNSDGGTKTGILMGTIDYMSPEQARGEHVDARSDIFTVGLILYELVTGVLPYKSDSVVAGLVRRTQEKAKPAAEVDARVPVALSKVISKCMALDPAERYQSAQELLAALDEFREKPSGTMKIALTVQNQARRMRNLFIASTVIVLVLAALGVWKFRSRVPTTGGGHAPISILISDFENQTGDEVFEGTIEPAFGLALEGASFITNYPRNQALKTAERIQPGTQKLNMQMAKLVATREGVSAVVAGSVLREGENYKIEARILEPGSDKTLAEVSSKAVPKQKVLQEVASLSGKLRGALGDSDLSSNAAAETFTSSSLEAAHAYAQAQTLRYSGKSEEAIQYFLKAVSVDSSFGTAYAGLAAMYANLGRRDDAVRSYKLAMSHEDRMTERERMRTRGGYYLATLDAQHAVDEFTALTAKYPADNMAHSALGFAYYLQRNMPKALEEGRRALEIYPKNVPYRNNVALYALYAGDFATAKKEASAAMQLNPAYVKCYITLALAEAALGNIDAANETYRSLAKVSESAKSFADTGMADLALFRGDTEGASSLLKAAIADDKAHNRGSAAAKKMMILSEAQLAAGDKAAALATVNEALKLDESELLLGAARLYVELGQYDKASALAKTLGAKLERVPQAEAKLIDAEVLIAKGKPTEAVQLLQSAVEQSDLWLARFALARAYLALNANAQAESEIENCIRRQGEATDVYLDETQTFRYFPPVYYYQGIERQGSKSGNAVEAFKHFLSLRDKATKDPLVVDAKKRVTQ